MNERPLPDDPAHWPDDPNELLGVSYGVSPRELRRAYNRLIRIYKPEQFPEQFRRIREAYEHLLRIAEMFADHAEASESPPAEEPQILPAPKEQQAKDAEPWNAGKPQPVEDSTDEEIDAVRAQEPGDEVMALWQAASAGRPAAAYERLMQWTRQYAGRVELYQRLYWLLTLWPEVDARRVPVDWLVQGLLATGLAGPLRELYREEVADNPAEALTERYEQLLEAPVPTALLADLIEWRFQAAARLQRWDIPNADLKKLRPRFGIGEEQLWLRLVFALADAAAWAGNEDGARLLGMCSEEIARHEHLARGMSHLFDRFDLLAEAAVGWLKACSRSRVPAPFLQLLAYSWSRPFGEVREPLLEILSWMAETPGIWLSHLDEMHKIAPATLALFGELLDRFEETQSAEADPSDREARNALAWSFLLRLNADDYKGERSQLLMFCLREHLAPEELAEAASGDWERALLGDWPLRYVCRANRLFWA